MAPSFIAPNDRPSDNFNFNNTNSGLTPFPASCQVEWAGPGGTPAPMSEVVAVPNSITNEHHSPLHSSLGSHVALESAAPVDGPHQAALFPNSTPSGLIYGGANGIIGPIDVTTTTTAATHHLEFPCESSAPIGSQSMLLTQEHRPLASPAIPSSGGGQLSKIGTQTTLSGQLNVVTTIRNQKQNPHQLGIDFDGARLAHNLHQINLSMSTNYNNKLAPLDIHATSTTATQLAPADAGAWVI